METVKGENMTAEERHKLLSPEEKKIYWRHQKEKKLYKELVPHYYNARYGQDAVDAPKVELRSEKVRNIIGQVPPVLLRYGIAIIGLALLALVGVSAFIPYQPGIATEITVSQDKNGLLSYTATIPQDAMKNNTVFTEVVAGTALELSLPTSYRIENISETVTVTGKKAWRTLVLIPQSPVSAPLQLENPVKLSGKVLQNKQSVMMWVVGKVRV